MSEANNKLNKEEVIETVKKMVGFMNVDPQIEVKEEPSDGGEKAMVVSIQTPDDARFLIGKNGQNLKALEHVVRAMLVKRPSAEVAAPLSPSPLGSVPAAQQKDNIGSGAVTIVLDVNDYRKSRANYLLDTAKQAVTRVRNTQKAEALFPMSAYERRIVHMELAAYPDIATESVGSEPQRRVIIKPYP